MSAAALSAGPSLLSGGSGAAGDSGRTFTLNPPPYSKLPKTVPLLTESELVEKYGDANVRCLIAVRPVNAGSGNAALQAVKQRLESTTGEPLMHMGMFDREIKHSKCWYNFNDPVGNANGSDKSLASFIAVDAKQFADGYAQPILFLDLPYLYDPQNALFVTAALKYARKLVQANSG